MHRKSADNNQNEATPQGSSGQAEALTVQQGYKKKKKRPLLTFVLVNRKRNTGADTGISNI